MKCITDMSENYSCIGKINNEGKFIINNKNLLLWYKMNPFKDKECRQCYKLPLCFGGCPIYFAKYNKRLCVSEDILITPFLYK